MTRFDYHEALKNTAKSMVRIKDPRRLLKMIVRFIVREVGLTHASILMYDDARSRYIFVDSKGSQRIPANLIKLDSSNPLIRWFARKERNIGISKDYVSRDMVEDWLNQSSLIQDRPSLRLRLHQILDVLMTLKASVCVPGYYNKELLGVLVAGDKVNRAPFDADELTFFQTLANNASMALKTAEYQDDLIEKNRLLEVQKAELEMRLLEIGDLRKKEQDRYYQIVMSLAREVYAKDPYTSVHLEGVERLGVMTAEELGYDLSGQKKDVLVAALHLHDVGKIGIPDHILKKPAQLTDEEWKIMRQHPVKGAKILEPLAGFEEVAKAVLHHHEFYDGTGYPAGLVGEEIPIESRIISVVDAFHAIISTRCYKKGQPVEFAFSELKRCSGKQFDSKVVDAFIRAYKRVYKGDNGELERIAS